MMISEKHSKAARETILKVIESGKSVLVGDKNGMWKGGSSKKKNYPCPDCNVDRLCNKSNAWRSCVSCGYKKSSLKRKGRKIPGNYAKGEKHYRWRGGISSVNQKIRSSHEYRNWRIQVFERDNYTCTECLARSGNGEAVVLNADHIKPFALYPDLRFLLSNGRTLCIDCHAKTDTYKGRVRAFSNPSSLTYG